MMGGVSTMFSTPGASGNGGMAAEVKKIVAADSARPPESPDAADEAVQAARTFERRRQIGLQGRASTFLQTAQPDSGGNVNAPTTILGA
jgi:hypothetical protein